MSLESAVEHLIAAINANTAAILQTAGKSTANLGAAQTPPPAEKAQAKDKPAAAAKKDPAPAAPAANDVTYATVAAAFIALGEKKGRDAAIAAIAPLPTLKEIKEKEQRPGQYAELLAAINKAAA